jgi:8-amino-7-oxononanoate synthase
MTEPASLQQVDRTCVLFRGRKLAYFSGCDYFRMASHPAVLRAVTTGAARYGLNVASSRLTTGNHALYRKLEHKLAKFFDAEEAVLVPSGYMTNLTVAQTLASQFTHALLDERAHVSLQDAAQFLRCPVLHFKHRDAADVARLVKRCGQRARIILLTNGMYSSPGVAAPLADYLRVLPKTSLLLVDDAHGAGVLGRTGKGTPEFTGTQRRRLVQTVTLSKAFGVYGGAVLCSRRLRREILAKSRLYVGSTPLPLPLANAALTALNLHTRQPALRARLHRNADRVKSALRNAGVVFPEGPGPIVQILPANPKRAAQLRRTLLAAGIFPPFVRYPGGPPGGAFRFVISSEHTPAQLDAMVQALRRNCGSNSSVARS